MKENIKNMLQMNKHVTDNEIHENSEMRKQAKITRQCIYEKMNF